MADEGTVDQIAAQIAGIESAGHDDPYSVYGPTTKTGDRAIGKYQIMGSNVPEWTREALGTAMSPEQFYGNADAQEKTARYRMGKYLDETGDPRDVASLWHSGKRYADAGDIADQLGTKTRDYADRVASALGSTGAVGYPSQATSDDVIVALPDGTNVNLGPNPSPELRQQVKQKIAEKFPQLTNFNTLLSPEQETAFEQWKTQYAPNDSGEDYDLRGAFQAGLTPDPTTGHWPDTFKKPNHPTFSDQSKYAPFAPTKAGRWEGDSYLPPATTTTTTTNAPAPKSFRETPVDDAGRAFNVAAGRDPEDWKGKYGAALAKPFADAISDVAAAFSEVNPASTGNPLELATWKDALSRSLQILHPLGVLGESAGNIVMQAASDAGASPDVAAGLAFAASLAGGTATPVPGLETPPGSKVPFQGTRATRAAAQEAETAAGQAEAAATAARTSGEAAAAQAGQETVDTAARGEQWVQAQRAAVAEEGAKASATAAEAQAAADRARAAVTPTPEAAARATEALVPEGTTATTGSRAAAQQLEQNLAEVRDPVKGIYDGLVAGAEAKGATLETDQAQRLLDQIDAIKEELGTTLAGQAKSVITAVENTITAGKPIGAKLLDDYRQQLDSLFPGRVPKTATPRQSALYQFKWDVRDVARSLYDDEERAWAEAADTLYRDTIIGKENPTALGNLVNLAKKNPDTFAERVLGSGTTDKQGQFAEAVLRELGDTPAASQLRAAPLARAIDKATNKTTGALDPADLLAQIDNWSSQFRKAIVSEDGEAFLRQLAKEQAEAPGAVAAAKTAGKTAAETMKAGESAVAAAERTADVGVREAERTAARIAKESEQATTAAEREAAKVRAAADAAKEVAAKPSKLARLTAAGLEIGATSALRHMGVDIPHGLLEAGGLLLTNQMLARAIADSRTANLLLRALKTPLNSPASITVIEALRNRNKTVNFMGKD